MAKKAAGKKAEKGGQSTETPLMKQYYQIKGKYPGALLLFRVGDFYETFGEDAVTTSNILGIILTKRNNGSSNEVELAGFPHHALDAYLPKLVRAGQRVAICDQLEDPASVKGIVKRGVTELVTPGVSYNDNVLDVNQNNFVAAVHFGKKQNGVAFLDISTGAFYVAEGGMDYTDKLLAGLNPSEVLYCKPHKHTFEEKFDDKYTLYGLDEWIFQYDFSYEKLTEHFGTQNLKGFGIEGLQEAITAAGVILHYLEETEHNETRHIAAISRIDEGNYVWLDRFTIRNLELLHPHFEGGVPLINILDKSVTPMGARLMRRWVVMPLKDVSQIKERLDIVEYFTQSPEQRETMLRHLRMIGDLERLISKVAARRINPREMLQLKKALQHIAPVKELLAASDNAFLKKIADIINACDYLLQKIENELREDVPIVTNTGNLIKENVHDELDQLRHIAYSGKDYLAQIQKREAERTGIPSLKIQYNKVFGYYLEVTHTHKDKVPADWIRKQTMVNAERYITEELKEYEEKILNAESEMQVLEQRLFHELVLSAGDYIEPIQQNARVLAEFDCLLAFAEVSVQHNYHKPEIAENNVMDIKEGRHPVIEQYMPADEQYVPNDIYLDDETQQIIIITGPNMSGKSALLRQTAIVTIMAQMGCFVPAASAKLGITDKVFTRVGASDNLSRGESTFMVEMTETASILNNLSNRSLVLMDEIGRGTSTYDGISIAWSIVEYLHNNGQFAPKTLFATHYHELNQLAEELPRVKNFNVSVKEAGDKIIFMRKLKEGGSEHSFGIHVAQIAGMPNPVLIRASEIMQQLEKDKVHEASKEKMKNIPAGNYQLSLFEINDPAYKKVQEMLENLDINRISPVEALMKLNEIKSLLTTQETNGNQTG